MKRAPLLVLQHSKVLKKFFWKFDAISKYQSYFSFYVKDHLWEGESQNCENGYTYSQKLRFCRVNHLLTPWWWKFQIFFCLFFNSGGQDIYFRSLKGVGSFQVREELRSVCCDFLTRPAEASLCLPQWAAKPFPGDPFWEGTWECWVTSIKDSTDRNMSSQGCFWDSVQCSQHMCPYQQDLLCARPTREPGRNLPLACIYQNCCSHLWAKASLQFLSRARGFWGWRQLWGGGDIQRRRGGGETFIRKLGLWLEGVEGTVCQFWGWALRSHVCFCC